MVTKSIRVEMIARVEGEGALDLHIRNGKVDRAHLSIFEPPRFFEAMLRGRNMTETPDIVARICGICPVAYQMSAVHAIEAALGISVDPQVRALRRLLYCGEWIESHALHVVMLHAPDFLGFEDAIQMTRDHGSLIKEALALKKTGNEIMRIIGGREIHPVNVRVGGFYRMPRRDEFAAVAEDLKRGRDRAIAVLRWVAGFEFPDFERDYEFVALRHPSEYGMNEGHIVSNRGLDIPNTAYLDEFEERHMPHSTALHSVLKKRGHYLVGPLARYNLNHDRLSPDILQLAKEAGLDASCRNPFRSIVVRAVELIFACDEAMRLIAAYEPPAVPSAAVSPPGGELVGHGCTEAPRGILYHRYKIAADGSLLDARIVPPTSQNQGQIEDDLRDIANAALDLLDDALRNRCEQSIRNYDPCISCSTHFLKLAVHRE
jgi:sulfhydrogenase subunit alpha